MRTLLAYVCWCRDCHIRLDCRLYDQGQKRVISNFQHVLFRVLGRHDCWENSVGVCYGLDWGETC